MKHLVDYIYHPQDDRQKQLCAQHRTILKGCFLPGIEAGFWVPNSCVCFYFFTNLVDTRYTHSGYINWKCISHQASISLPFWRKLFASTYMLTVFCNTLKTLHTLLGNWTWLSNHLGHGSWQYLKLHRFNFPNSQNVKSEMWKEMPHLPDCGFAPIWETDQLNVHLLTDAVWNLRQ